MKNRIILIILLIMFLFAGYMLYTGFLHAQPKRVVFSFLHELLEADQSLFDGNIEYKNKYLKYLLPELKDSSFLKLVNLNMDLKYKITKTEDISDNKVKVWVTIIESENNEKIPVPFTVKKTENKWLIASLPKLDIYSYGIPKLSENSTGNEEWFFETGLKTIRLYEQPSNIILQKNIPSSFVLLEDRLLHLKKLQPIHLPKVLSLTDQKIEDIRLGYFQVAREFPVYADINGELHYIGNRSIPSGTENVALYRSREGIGRLAVIPSKDNIIDKIRVLLSNTYYTDILHDTIKITCSDNFTVESKVDKIKYNLKPEDILQFKTDGREIELLINGKSRITAKHRWFVSADNSSRLKVLNINRMKSVNGTAYRGSLEVALAGNKLCLVNEVNLEEYLYSVVPSEMPVNFGLEALKVQAVAARAYAVRSMESADYVFYGAHVTDSTGSQVYNNIEEADIAKRAVDETAGLVPFFDNKVINACFFSTSCGYTAGSHEVWSDKDGAFPSAEVPYLQAASQYSGNAPSLYNEKNFRAFISQKDLPAYDKFSPFFRWSTMLGRNQLEAVIAANLADIYKQQPGFILTRTSDNTFVSMGIPDDIGELLNIEVIKRGTGGNIMELDISTTQGTFRIIKEYNIRRILQPVNYINGRKPVELKLNDNTVRKDFPILPSAFAYIDFTRDIEGNIENIVINGGGYGHGVGMSQHGTYGLTLLGKSYIEILEHYYPKCEIKNIYEHVR